LCYAGINDQSPVSYCGAKEVGRSQITEWFSSIRGQYASLAFLAGLAIFAAILVLNWLAKPPGATANQIAAQPWQWWLAILPFALAAFGCRAGKRQDTLLEANRRLELDLGQRIAEIERITLEREHENAERQRAERIISRGKREWEATFDAVADSILITDQYGMIIRCNRSAIQRAHTTFNELIGRSIDEVFLGESITGLALFPGQAKEFELPVLSSRYEIASYPLMVEGVTRGTIYTVRDVTEHKGAQAEFVSQEQLAE
jgi:PAS domain-containing protein